MEADDSIGAGTPATQVSRQPQYPGLQFGIRQGPPRLRDRGSRRSGRRICGEHVVQAACRRSGALNRLLDVNH